MSSWATVRCGNRIKILEEIRWEQGSVTSCVKLGHRKTNQDSDSLNGSKAPGGLISVLGDVGSG